MHYHLSFDRLALDRCGEDLGRLNALLETMITLDLMQDEFGKIKLQFLARITEIISRLTNEIGSS